MLILNEIGHADGQPLTQWGLTDETKDKIVALAKGRDFDMNHGVFETIDTIIHEYITYRVMDKPSLIRKHRVAVEKILHEIDELDPELRDHLFPDQDKSRRLYADVVYTDDDAPQLPDGTEFDESLNLPESIEFLGRLCVMFETSGMTVIAKGQGANQPTGPIQKMLLDIEYMADCERNALGILTPEQWHRIEYNREHANPVARRKRIERARQKILSTEAYKIE